MDVLTQWKAIPKALDAFIGTGAGAVLDELVAPEKYALTRRQVVHHLAEANIVAASILIAALGSPGCTYDWSWMMPFGPWLERLDYAHKPVEPSLNLLASLNAYVVAQIEPLPDALSREVWLRDGADAPLRRLTVADVLQQEVDHALEHLGELSG